MTNLLPCPFCRSDAYNDKPTWRVFGKRTGHEYAVACSYCEAAAPGDDDLTLAFTAWNTRADLPSPQDAARIAELEAGRQSAHVVMSRAFEVIEICHRVLHFNLNRMIADDSDDYNQAVRDAADATHCFMQEISAAHAIALAADSGAADA